MRNVRQFSARLVTKATIRDAITGEAIAATPVIVGGKVIAEGVSEFKFVLPGEQLDYVFLEVQVLDTSNGRSASGITCHTAAPIPCLLS